MQTSYFLFAVLLNLTGIAFAIFSSASVARRISGTHNVMFLVVSCIVLFFAHELLIFWILAPISQFSNLNVFVMSSALALCVNYFEGNRSRPSPVGLWGEQLKESLQFARITPVYIFSIITLILVFLHMVASCILPIMGWDYVAYRGLKAGLFIQNKGLFNIGLPGGWQFYKLMPGNMEVIFSYLMLGTRNDFFVTIFDFLIFLLLPLPVWAYSLQRTDSDWRLMQALLIWWLPLLYEGVGFAQTETEITFLILAATLFMLDFIREKKFVIMGMCGLSLGIAYGIKPIVLPQILVFAITTCIVSVKNARRAFLFLVVFFGSFLSLSLPWFICSLIETGLPLSPLPINFLGIQLGSTTEAMNLNMSRIGSVPYVRFEELGQIANLFFTWDRLAFGYLGFAELIVLLICLFYSWRTSKVTSSLCLMIFMSGVIAYFQPSMRLNRVFYHSGRYLVHAISALFFLFERPSRNPVWYILPVFLIGGLMLNAIPRTRSYPTGGMETLLLLFLAIPLTLFLTKKFSGHIRVAVSIFLLTMCAALATSLRTVAVPHYFKLIGQVNPGYYWIEAISDSIYKGKGHRIAVTAGRYEKLSNHLLYHFLGASFQNSLVYVLPYSLEPGRPVIFPEASKVVESRNEWINQLVANRIEYVLSLRPGSPELLILNSSPKTFYPISRGTDWGFFCVIPVGKCKDLSL